MSLLACVILQHSKRAHGPGARAVEGAGPADSGVREAAAVAAVWELALRTHPEESLAR